jgi:hypothetical protein
MKDDNCKPCKTETLNYFNHDGNYYVDCKSKNRIYRCIYDVKLVEINKEKKIKELEAEFKSLNKSYIKEIESLRDNFEKRLKNNNKELIKKKNLINSNLEKLISKINIVKNNLNYIKKKKFNPVVSKKLKKDLNLTYNIKKKEPVKKNKQVKQNKQSKQIKQKKEVKQTKNKKKTSSPKKQKMSKKKNKKQIKKKISKKK